MSEVIGYKNVHTLPITDSLTENSSEVLASSKAITTINNKLENSSLYSWNKTQFTIPTTISITDNKFSINVPGVTETNIVFLTPTPETMPYWQAATIFAVTQTTDTITFSCTSAPTNDILVDTIIFN